MKRIIIASLILGSSVTAFAQSAPDSTAAFVGVIDQRDAAQAVAQAELQKQQDAELARQQRLADESADLDMKMKRARAAHADDYARADLKRLNAETDVVQSNADANRNYSKQRPVAPVIVRCGYWGC